MITTLFSFGLLIFPLLLGQDGKAVSGQEEPGKKPGATPASSQADPGRKPGPAAESKPLEEGEPSLSVNLKNLVKNGDFEKGKKESGPAHWQPPDGLCSFRVKAQLRKGWIMKFDTNVLLQEYRARKEEMKSAKPPPPKPKTEAGDRPLKTVAASEGVGFLSDPIPVEKGRPYRLRVDCRAQGGKKGEMNPKVFVVGYLTFRGEERKGYKIYKTCEAGENWRTFSLDFNPTVKSPQVTHVRVKIFPYWPPCTYYFDNVILEALPPGVESLPTSPAPEQKPQEKQGSVEDRNLKEKKIPVVKKSESSGRGYEDDP